MSTTADVSSGADKSILHGMIAHIDSRKIVPSMKTTLMRLGICVAGVVILALFAWGTRMALRPISRSLASYYYGEGFREQKAGKLDAAMVNYDRAIALDPKLTRVYVNRGVIEAGLGRTKEAIADYDRALALDPKDYRPYLGRGRARGVERDLPGALADFDRSIALYARLPLAFRERSEVRVALGDMEGAMKDAEEAMKLEPNEFAYVTRSWVKKVNGDMAGARADLERAIQINPKSAWIYEGRGQIEYMNGQWKEALGDFRHFCELSEFDQDYPRLIIWLARARLGETEEASKELAAYLKVRRPGRYGDWPPTLAKFLVGQLSEEELFAAAKAANPEKARGRLCEVCYYAGEKKWLAGDATSAAENFRKCVETAQFDYAEYGFAKAELKELGR
jgi:tetratricopeptide (TPR) repeat protein